MTVPVDPIAIALSVSHVLETLGISHTVGGSLASSFAGEPRSTVDIDFVAALEESHIPRIVSALSADFYVDGESLRRAVRDRASANLIRHSTQLKVLGIIRVQGPRLDRAYVTANAPALGVADLVTRALNEAAQYR